MSREVEVSNIQMTATVPEDVQISLGQIGTIGTGGTITASTSRNAASLDNGLGGLVTAEDKVVAPSTNEWDWSNLADISEYYQFGKLIPASSNTGAKIFFTNEANGNGQTLIAGAKFYAANNDTNILTAESDAGNGVYSATAHVINKKSNGTVNDTWSIGTASYENGAKYTTASAWNKTNDDGYYVDVPVWLRTSSTAGAKLSVMAYVKPKTTTTTLGPTDEKALYRAVRVSVLDVGDESAAASATTGTTKGLIPVTDGWDGISQTQAGTGLKSAPFALTKTTYAESILNWYGRTVGTGASAAAALPANTTDATAAVASISSNAPSYGAPTVYNIFDGTNEANVVATLAPPTVTEGAKTYGAAHKVIIRVWLEGEDPDCWNETAGQDWSINLRFNNELTTPTTGDSTGGADLDGVNTGKAPHGASNNNEGNGQGN